MVSRWFCCFFLEKIVLDLGFGDVLGRQQTFTECKKSLLIDIGLNLRLVLKRNLAALILSTDDYWLKRRTYFV